MLPTSPITLRIGAGAGVGHPCKYYTLSTMNIKGMNKKNKKQTNPLYEGDRAGRASPKRGVYINKKREPPRRATPF